MGKVQKKKTIRIGKMTERETNLGDFLYPERGYWKPKTREQCVQGIRPCPYVSCKYHLYLDVTEIGSLVSNFPDLEVWDMKESCTLDIAEGGCATREKVGEALNLTRERARQIEEAAAPHLRKHLRKYQQTKEER